LTDRHKIDRWKSLVPSPRYTGERVRVRGLQLYIRIEKQKVSWIVAAEIRGFFDNINHDGLLKFLEHRIANR
jgi:hypothetical protein